MVNIKPWQVGILVLPIAAIIIFLLVAAGSQIHDWGINWIWGVVVVIFAVWRWLLVRWTKPAMAEIESVMEEIDRELDKEDLEIEVTGDKEAQVSAFLSEVIAKTKTDEPFWQDWVTFWQRCQELVSAIAQIYNPDVKRPFLNIYIPQAYGLIRGTVDDTDRMMQKLTPVLNRVSIGQAYEAYETYRNLEPSLQKIGKVFNWSQWLINPAAAVAKQATRKFDSRANQELLLNLGQLLRETALKNLAQQAIALYGDETIVLPEIDSESLLPHAKTQTLKEILASAESPEAVEQKPLNIILVGRTGAGKSSLINTLFQADRAEVDVLPSTDRIKTYTWQTPTGETLNLLDTPGYEQINRPEFRQQVLDYAATADLLLLVTPALDPALQMDLDFLQTLQQDLPDLNAIVIVTQVDRLRPIREWNPPYDWREGNKPKEKSIRDATSYRVEELGDICELVLPIVTEDQASDRQAWGVGDLSWELVQAIAPSKQLRLARYLKSLEVRSKSVARIIDHYTRQMSTAQGLAVFLKSPILQTISTFSTGNSALAYVLAEQIPIEQAPLVIGKLQMAYDLYVLLNDDPSIGGFDLRALWSLLLDNDSAGKNSNAWALGNALVEYWSKDLDASKLKERYRYYQSATNN
ncbi:MAG: GTPase [Cyanobacteria bacterium P01_G01_bin.19]